MTIGVIMYWKCWAIIGIANSLFIFIGFPRTQLIWSAETEDEKNLIKPGLKHEIPKDLLKTYSTFVRDLKNPTIRLLASHCLPNSVEITIEPREEKWREYGSTMNIPFLLRGFNAQLVSVKKLNEDVYLLETLTSGLWYVRTKEMGWKIYQYEDSPPE